MNIPFPPRKYLALLCAALLPAFFAPNASGQVSISPGATVSENFSSLSTNAIATLPSGWRASKSTTVRQVTAYSSAVTATERAGGANLSSSAGNGIYNFGSSSTDRAVGGLSSGSASTSVNVYVALQNTGGSAIPNITVSYKAERYRNGSNSAGFSIQLYYSTDGNTWTSAGANFLSSFAANADNNGAAIVPIQTITVTSQNLPVSIPAGSTIYLAWNYSVTSGTTTSNAQAIGVSDIEIAAAGGGGGTPPVITTFDPASGTAGTAVTIGGSNFTGATNVAFNGVAASFSNVTDTTLSATVPAGALSGPISVSTPSGLATSTNSFLVPTVSVVLPATINEGTSSFGEVLVNVEPTNDIEVVLTSSSTNDLTVETPITIFAGTTNYFFSITAPSDSIIDANTNVTVTPAAAGYAAAPGTISVVNVDAVTIPLTTFASNSYTQNFDSLGTTTISNVIPATSNVQAALGAAVSTNLNGWFATQIAASAPATNIVANDGSSSSGAIYNYGSTNSPANLDRSLGALATGSMTGAFGALVVNDTGSTINSIIINLTGKFWRSSTSAQNFLSFGYGKIDNTLFSNNNFLSAAGASALPSANVVGPAPVASNGPLDGNAPANQTLITNVAIPVQLLPGETMFFRWQDFNNAGNDAGLAIDNLSLTASTNLPLPVIGSVSIDQLSLSQTAATASSSVVSDGGSSLTSRGFVYALTSVSSNPVIGGSNVVVVTNDPPEVSAFTNTFTGLSADVSYSVRSFVVNGAGTNYSSAVQFSTLPVPPSFTGAYTQTFNGFTNMAALPLGWRALSTSNINNYAGDWNATNSVSAGFYGRTNIPGVLGYLHTSSTGILSNTLTLVNNTGGTLTNLFVSYVGEVNVLGTNNTRFPSWTVVVDGQTNAALAYSTASGSNEFKTAEIAGLNISNGGSIVISWWSDRGTNNTGSSRMIGMSGVRVATNAAGAPMIGVSGALSNFATTFGTASASQSFSASGSDLIADISVTAPTNYQVSLDNASFASSVTLLQTNGTVASTPVYVRIADTAPIGSPAGSVTLASSGASSQNVLVSGSVSPTGETFANWAQGAPLDSANLLKYAIGGASSPIATNGIAMSNAVTSSNLSITAIVRTNDPNLSVVGQAVTDLTTGPWSTNNVTMEPGDQSGVGEGLQRQIWSTPRNSDSKKFLRLQSTLSNQ
jgi:hypothetical protein